MIDVRAQNLLFAAPGIAHLLGNALFTVQGRARLLSMSLLDTEATREQLDGDAQAVLEGATRSLGSLAVLRWTLAESRTPAALGHVLAELASVVRVPLRDHGASLRIEQGDGAEEEVDPADTVACLLSALRRVAEGAHRSSFTVELAVQRIDGAPAVALRCVDEEGGLHPLGRALDDLAAAQDPEAPAWRMGETPDLLVLVLTRTLPNLRTS